MADNPKVANIKIPNLQPVPYVVLKLASGQVVLRHPDEVKKR